MDENKGKELFNCIERIEELYMYDTVTLLDCVLTDDDENPEYSANIVIDRLSEIILFEKLYFKIKVSDIKDWLLSNGYTIEDYNILKEKKRREDQEHYI